MPSLLGQSLLHYLRLFFINRDWQDEAFLPTKWVSKIASWIRAPSLLPHTTISPQTARKQTLTRWRTNDSTPFSLQESPSDASQSFLQPSPEGRRDEESALLQAATLCTISKQIAHPLAPAASCPNRGQGQRRAPLGWVSAKP